MTRTIRVTLLAAARAGLVMATVMAVAMATGCGDDKTATEHFDQAMVHFQKGEKDTKENARAIEEFSLALDKDPDLVEAQFYRGLAHARVFDCDRAVADFDAVIAAAPGRADAYYRRALCLVVYGDAHKPRAVADLEKALDLDPAHKEAAHMLRLLTDPTLNRAEAGPLTPT